MLATALVVFREVLEAALVIGIAAAATRGVPGRSRWLLAGLVLGLLGAGLVAAGTEAISSLADGIGQELLNAAILSIAVVMLGWHNLWMAAHGRELADQARAAGDGVRTGRQAGSVLMVLVGVAVLREGAETVLFLYGIAAGGGTDRGAMLAGGALGVAGGVGVGLALYRGLLGIPVRWFFAATAGLVLLLAAGMAAQAVGFLIQADVVPSLADPAWDTSGVLADDSALGRLLHGLVGYAARPAGSQVIAWLAVVAALALGMRQVARRGAAPARR